MRNYIIKFLELRRYNHFLKMWRALAVAYKDMGESDHWIRARITEYINHEDADDSVPLMPKQTKDDYIELILSVLNESRAMSR